MFSLFTILAILFAALPMSATPFLTNANLQHNDSALNWQIKDFPTPTGIQNAVNFIPETPESNSNKPTSAPGQTISQIARDPHDGGISDQVHEIIPGNKFSPTPIISPVPVTADTPTPTPGEINPSIYPMPTGTSGCPPCGNGGNGKYACPDVLCPM
jgi:hypothetical protein